MNLKVKVDLGVEINKARVELNHEQKEEVSNFVTSLLFGRNMTSSVGKGKTRHEMKARRVFGRKSWSREEEVRFMDLARQYGPESRNQTQFFRTIGREMGRSPMALLNRLSLIRRGKGELSPNDVPNSVIPDRGIVYGHNQSPVNDGPSNNGPIQA